MIEYGNRYISFSENHQALPTKRLSPPCHFHLVTACIWPLPALKGYKKIPKWKTLFFSTLAISNYKPGLRACFLCHLRLGYCEGRRRRHARTRVNNEGLGETVLSWKFNVYIAHCTTFALSSVLFLLDLNTFFPHHRVPALTNHHGGLGLHHACLTPSRATCR